jgi:hypothetical protein
LGIGVRAKSGDQCYVMIPIPGSPADLGRRV